MDELKETFKKVMELAKEIDILRKNFGELKEKPIESNRDQKYLRALENNLIYCEVELKLCRDWIAPKVKTRCMTTVNEEEPDH